MYRFRQVKFLGAVLITAVTVAAGIPLAPAAFAGVVHRAEQDDSDYGPGAGLPAPGESKAAAAGDRAVVGDAPEEGSGAGEGPGAETGEKPGPGADAAEKPGTGLKASRSDALPAGEAQDAAPAGAAETAASDGATEAAEPAGEEHWEERNGKWYYLNRAGEAMKDTVIVDRDGNYYCLDGDGVRITSGEVFRAGLPWTFLSDGRAQVKESEDETAIREHASELASKLTKGKKTDEAKIRAIFDHVRGLDFDGDGLTDGDLQDAAVKAFDTGKANCYGIAAELHYLLQAAGYPDMIVRARSGEEEESEHWWNMVKVGEKYRHLDATPFEGFEGFFLLTTEELMEESGKSAMTEYLHRYREDDYPAAD